MIKSSRSKGRREQVSEMSMAAMAKAASTGKTGKETTQSVAFEHRSSERVEDRLINAGAIAKQKQQIQQNQTVHNFMPYLQSSKKSFQKHQPRNDSANDVLMNFIN